MKTCRELNKRYAEATIAFMVTNSFEDFAPEIVEEQLNKKQELEIFTDEFLRPFEEMRALETNEDGTVSLVIFFKNRSRVILTSTEPNIFRMLFSIKNQKLMML